MPAPVSFKSSPNRIPSMEKDSSKQRRQWSRLSVLCLVFGAQVSALTSMDHPTAAGWSVHDVVVVVNAFLAGAAWLAFVSEEDRRSDSSE